MKPGGRSENAAAPAQVWQLPPLHVRLILPQQGWPAPPQLHQIAARASHARMHGQAVEGIGIHASISPIFQARKASGGRIKGRPGLRQSRSARGGRWMLLSAGIQAVRRSAEEGIWLRRIESLAGP